MFRKRKPIKYIVMCMLITGALFLSACGNKESTSLDETEDITDINIENTKEPSDEMEWADDKEISDMEGLSNIEEPSFEGISFVQKDYFYKDTVNIEIVSDKPCDIYYTMDGSEPNKAKKLYQNGIEIKSSTQVKVHPIKAKGYYQDGTETKTIVHTYFVGKNINKRFDSLVFAITSDPYNLYDYEYGILIPGKLRDDFIRSNPNKQIDPPDPANFNMRGRESEREAYLEIFEADGKVVASQKTGIRAYGGWSRANNQKSLKIFARRSYDQINNKIRYGFFPDKKAAAGDGTIINAYKRLVLRNTGNDNGFGFIRDELFQTLAGQAGFRDYQAVRPVALFINGEYRGNLWLHEVYCDEYFEQHYGEYTGSFEILEGGETYKKADEDEANEYAIKDYEEAYSYTYKDLTNDDIYNKLREVIDVENYLEYYVLQILIGNEDWPHNNYKVYRYYPSEGEEYRVAPFDGKWRYLLHDLDFSFGIYGTGPWEDNLRKYVSKPGEISSESPLFSQLLQREDCKEYFIIKTLDLINGAFSPDNLNKVLDEMHKARLNEHRRMYDTDLIADWVKLSHLSGQINNIEEYGYERINYTFSKYREYFSLGDIFNLNVKPAKGAGVRINNIEAYSEFNGRFYSRYDTVISAIVPVGKEFSHWIVNDEIVYGTELRVNSSHAAGGDVKVTFKLNDKIDNPRIIISKISSDGDKDYIMIYNPNKEDINLIGYSITDDADEPGKLILPARLLRAGHSLKILGESNREKASTGMIRAGFNLKDGETVSLYLKGELVDEVTIPNLKKGNIYVRDLLTMKFSEEKSK